MQKPAHILQHRNYQLDVVPIQIVDQKLDTVHRLLWIDYLELGELADVLQEPTLFIICHESICRGVFYFFVLRENYFVDPVPNIFVIEIYSGYQPAEVGSDQVIFFSVLKTIFHEQLPCFFVVDHTKTFAEFIAIQNIFATV